MSPEVLSAAQARRITLAAQGLLDPKPPSFTKTVSRLGVLQIDSVNVLTRAHYMPLFSRMGNYDRDQLRQASAEAPRTLVEYWAHVAAFMPVELWPAMQHRMRRYRERGHAWMGLPESPRLVESLMAELTEHGGRTSRDLDDGLPRVKQHWGWNWSETKKALEYLFFAGELAVSGRNSAFERQYDLPERVIPAHILAAPEPTVSQAHRELVRRAAISHGVATEQCLRDYYRMEVADAKGAIADLVEDGELTPVGIEGWKRPAYLHRDARLPRKAGARALLSPFDPLVWERARTEALFDFHYRIEIYVPELKRVHGYYVLPFLLGDRLVARVDLKADRVNRVLVVKSAYAEVHAPAETPDELAGELHELADWLGLEQVVVEARGDLSAALAVAIGFAG